MIECDTCQDWFHPSCVSLDEKAAMKKKKSASARHAEARAESKEVAMTLRDGDPFLKPSDFANLDHKNIAFSPNCKHCRCSQVAPTRLERQENVKISRIFVVQTGDFPWLLGCMGGENANSTYYCYACKTKCSDLKAGTPHICHVTLTAEEKEKLAKFEDVKTNTEPRTQRENYEDAKQYAEQKKKDAKKTHSILRKPIWALGLDLKRQVAKSPLHVMLGVGKKLIDMVEGLAEELDYRIKMLRAVAAGLEEAAETVDQEGKNAQKEEPRMKLMRIYQRATILEEAAKSKRAALSKELKKLKTLEESLEAAREPAKKKSKRKAAIDLVGNDDRIAYWESLIKAQATEVKTAQKEVDRLNTKTAKEAQENWRRNWSLRTDRSCDEWRLQGRSPVGVAKLTTRAHSM